VSPGEWVIAMLLLLCFKTKCICAVDMAVACDIHRKLDIWLRRHKETEVFIVQLLIIVKLVCQIAIVLCYLDHSNV